MSGQTDWLDRHCHQKQQAPAPEARESMRDMLSRFSTERIAENLKRDQERGLYTFFDYMNAAMKLPNEILQTLSEVPEIERREFVRSVSYDMDRPTPRIWRKVTFVDSIEDEK